MTHSHAIGIRFAIHWSGMMKRLIILTACVALLLSGCRNCSWFRRNRGAPCNNNLTFTPYTAPAPAPPAAAGCGLDAYAGEIGCGQDVTVGYGSIPNCPNCQVNGGFVGAGSGYYPDSTVTTPVPIETTPVTPPVGGGQ